MLIWNRWYSYISCFCRREGSLSHSLPLYLLPPSDRREPRVSLHGVHSVTEGECVGVGCRAWFGIGPSTRTFLAPSLLKLIRRPCHQPILLACGCKEHIIRNEQVRIHSLDNARSFALEIVLLIMYSLIFPKVTVSKLSFLCDIDLQWAVHILNKLESPSPLFMFSVYISIRHF